MRGHDQRRRRVRSRAWSPLILVATFACASGSVRGQDAPEAETVPTRSRDAVSLAASRVRVWDMGGDRWVHLKGRAAVLQGVDGLRAGEALVRVVSAQGPAGTTYRLIVYAEGLLNAEGETVPGRTYRTTLETDSPLRVNSYDSGGLSRLPAPPERLPLLARSGLLRREPAPDARQKAEASPIAFEPVPEGVSTIATASPGNGVPDPAVAASQPVAPVVVLSPPESLPASPTPAASRKDSEVIPTQFPGNAEPTDDPASPSSDLPPPAAPPDLERAPTVPSLPSEPRRASPSTELEPLPGEGGASAPPLRNEPARPKPPAAPVTPGTQRVTRVYPRNGGPNFQIQRLPVSNGTETTIIRGGVNIVIESPPRGFGIVDISADSAIIWRKIDEKGKSTARGPNGEEIEDARQPMELYLEGDVVVRQDERKVAGNGDQKTYRAKQAYYDVLSERFVGFQAELNMFAPGLVAPARILSPRIEQYRPFRLNPDGTGFFDLAEIRADKVMGTGSRFPNPAYQFTSRSVDINRVVTDERDPNSGKAVGAPGDPNAPQDLTWRIDARQNFFWMGPIPVFYWPRFVANADDLEPPLRQFSFRTNNYFGQQVLSDWNGFRLLGIQKPKNVDIWNVDLDYLSARTKSFPALGSEIGWFGSDLINDLSDPYGKVRGKAPSFTQDYFGYLDLWGLRDYGRDTLGAGPAIITNNNAAANVGYQRGGGGPLGAVPPFQDYRGKLAFRHMQRFLPDDDEHAYEDFRAQIEVGYISDRHFLEQYYQRLFNVGMDQETLGYLIRQKQNTAWTIWGEANLQNWYTDTQWLPRLDYYRLGDSLFTNTEGNGPSINGVPIFKGLTSFNHSGVNYANTHTAAEVNNPYIFAFMPYDPISNTSGVLKSFRAYTNQEVDMPLNFGNVFRFVPYVQGQAVGWSNQINGQSLGRVWGGVGARAEVMAWKAYPWVQSELMNVHGINHKINLEADFRAAYSNQNLNSIGVQDDLDDNTYEEVRRYFALTNYAGGLLPAQYDPRHLILRQTLSPITGPTDIQASITSLRMGIHQRLQTKRGPEGKRRIIDYMTLDLDTTYFPDAARDNFNKPFGQNTYNWQWFLGDRTSILSSGWFEFWNIAGNPMYKTNINRHNNPFGLNVITSGVMVTRPPRGTIFVGYSVIDTGPINTSALNVSTSYWLSPKWYGSYSTMYDFGNGILLAAMFSLTRIGADYLTSVGLNVDPQRQSYMFSVVISPRLSPNVKLGSGTGLNSFDSRYAPTQ